MTHLPPSLLELFRCFCSSKVFGGIMIKSRTSRRPESSFLITVKLSLRHALTKNPLIPHLPNNTASIHFLKLPLMQRKSGPPSQSLTDLTAVSVIPSRVRHSRTYNQTAGSLGKAHFSGIAFLERNLSPRCVIIIIIIIIGHRSYQILTLDFAVRRDQLREITLTISLSER